MTLSDEDREELTAYLDGEADDESRAKLEARLNREPAFRAEAEALKKAWELLDHLPRSEPSPTFTSQTMDRLTLFRPTSSPTIAMPVTRQGVPWGLVLAAVAGIALGWIVTNALLKTKANSNLDLNDPLVVKELRLINNLPLYLAVENLEFLQALDRSDRFSTDSAGP